ncbi:unnamed protein product [Moneuplotes crassus]|uniref:Uncharacterized protein n=1 Tax=Euplotes crassus TaxID=5936 RepID=A0AAD2CWR7_EUPCR|nr:unnamed protein product [Moneuplotes crassus]
MNFFKITVGIKATSSSNHSKIMGSLWRVYSILLEFCCKNDYQLLISKIKTDHEVEKQSLKDRIQSNHEKYIEQEIEFRKKFKEIEAENAVFAKEKITTKRYTAKLNDMIDDLRVKIEEETRIRKLFENKLNDLHSIVRDKDAAYNRAKVDLDHLLQDNINKDDQLSRLLKEYKELSEKKTEFQVQYDSIVAELNQAQKDFEREKLERVKETKHLREDLQKTRSSLLKVEKNYKENLQDLQQLRQVHHEMSKNYSNDKHILKRYYRDGKSIKKLESTIEGLKKECNELTEDVVGTREREIQYKKISDEAKQETSEIREELNKFIVKHSGLKSKLTELEVNYNNKCLQFKEQGVYLEESEKERQRVNEINEMLKSQNTHLEKEVKDKFNMVVIQRESMNRLKNKLIKVENDYDSLNGKNNTDREVLQTQIYQLKHEISVLTDKVDILKTSRGHLVRNLETEAEENEKLRGTVHTMKTKLSEEFNEKKNIEGECNKLDQMRIKTEQILSNKEDEVSQLFKQRESLNLKLHTKNEMNHHFEKKTSEYIQRIRTENKKLKDQIKLEKDRGLMLCEDIRTQCANTCQKYQQMLLEKIEAQKSVSRFNKRIHSLECDIEVAHIRIKNLKLELNTAKNTYKVIENKYKEKKNEINKIKQELKTQKSENEIFKKVIYDTKVSKPMPATKKSQSDLNVSISKIIEIKKGRNGENVQIKNVITETNSNVSSIIETCEVAIMTDACKRKDNFMQTEAHGFVEIQDIIRRNSLINVRRKISSNTAIGIVEKSDQDKISKHAHSESSMEKFIFARKEEKTGDKTMRNNQYNEIDKVIKSESESVSQNTNLGIRNRDLEESIKIGVSPLEQVTTIKASQTNTGHVVVSKIVDCVNKPSKSSNKPKGMKTRNHQTRATTSNLHMKPLMGPNYLQLHGERMERLKATSKYKRNPSSIEGEFKTTLMSDRISRNTSIDEVKNTMDAVYEQESNTRTRVLSPITKASSFHNLKPIDWERLEKTISPSRNKMTHKFEPKYFRTRNKKMLSSRNDMRQKIKRAVSCQ